MPQVIITDNARAKLRSIWQHYAKRDEEVAKRAVDAIIASFEILTTHPHVGRPAGAQSQLRELVIPFGSYGFVALYQLSPDLQTVIISAIRHQREEKYEEEH